jgi:membrane protease YdiL (CAAX protease family)
MTGIWLSAFVFGLAHFDIANSIGTGLLGLGLGYLRMRTGSILPSILLHMTFNAVGFTIMVTAASN